jgi:hypothetical protein
MLSSHIARSLARIAPTVAMAAVMSMPAIAQTTSGGGTTAGTAARSTTSETRRDDRGFDWGWLGLIGLAGLLGRRKATHVHRVDTTGTTAQR